jgi:hypothetical protein
MRQGRLSNAISFAQAAVRDGINRNEPNSQIIACAYLAAAYAQQQQFTEAIRQAKDCRQMLTQIGNIENRSYAQALLAFIYQMQIDALSGELVSFLVEGKFDATRLREKALKRRDYVRAMDYYTQITEFDNGMRRARWIPAISHAVPLIWIPVIDDLPLDPRLQRPKIIGYMEPVLFVRHDPVREGYARPTLFLFCDRKSSHDIEQCGPREIAEMLYAMQRIPGQSDPDSSTIHTIDLNPDIFYVAVKIDPLGANEPGFEPDDYLLIRSVKSSEQITKLPQPPRDEPGWSFEFREDDTILFTELQPKVIGKSRHEMFDARQIEAILRRIP